MQIRPRDGGPAYNPQRDLAYIYAPAMQEALRALDEEVWSDDIRELVKRLGITEESISAAVQALTKAHMSFVNDPAVTSAKAALVQAGWYNHPVGARYLIYGRLGEVMLGGFFLALRDVSEIADESAQQREIADFIAEGEKLLGIEERPEGINWGADARARRQELRLQRHAMAAQMQQFKELRKNFNTVNYDYSILLERYKHEGFWSGLWRLIRTRLLGWDKTREPDNDKQTS